MFVDRVKLNFIAGKGGNGIVSWRREKFIPKGGPNGGNGGKGASIYLEADAQIFSLDDFRNKRIIKAENGQQGGPNLCQGRNGKDLIVKVPCGTLIKDVNSEEIIADLTKDKQRFLICQGGKGGRGNESFKTPTNRAPNTCTPGKAGEERKVELELKLIADVGLVGFPNAGKSTLISALTHIRVKIAAYPFTTLRPNLGFLTLDDYSRVFIADIPGIIEGAHNDKGLGFEFLRHIERTLLLIYVLDASGIDGRHPLDDWKILRKEIKAYNPEILEKPFLVVLNKIDDPQSEENIKAFRKGFKESKSLLYEISAKEGEGLPELLQVIGTTIQKIRV
jgi:GTP-binding protein